MSDPTSSPPHHTVDPYQLLGLVRNPDGSITRQGIQGLDLVAPDSSPSIPVLTKDVPLNQSKQTSLRIFLPREALDSSRPPTKLPLIVYYHGGGFILCNAASPIFHVFCSILAAEIQAVIVSVDYRLAPEHRLPAAYDDCEEALHWIKSTQDDWLSKYADFSNCFIMGTSAGGNLAYHVGLRASAADDLEPLKIGGLILHQPFFGGATRTQSELRLVNDRVIPLCATDLMWDLGLPIGVDRDHEYCNPTVEGGSPLCDRIGLLGWRVLVTGCDGDPLMDRQVELTKLLEKKGVRVVGEFSEGGYHGVDCIEPDKAVPLGATLKHFIFP